MAATILSGRRIALSLKRSLKREVANITKNVRMPLALAVLRIGGNPASEVYLKTQQRVANEFGIRYSVITLPKNVSQKKAEETIRKLNKDTKITGVIIHTPLPKHIDDKQLFATIACDKDVEGLNPTNIGRLVHASHKITPCTAAACMKLLDSAVRSLRGKEVVIVGHSEIVGKPLALMCLERMATTTVCHIATSEKGRLKDHVHRAEVLIVSVGKPNLIKGSWIRRGAVVIDVGISRQKGTITGDVEFAEAKKRASYITPVPGGVGPLTAVMLIKNLISLHYMKRGKNRCISLKS